ncbi:hypothetical protein DV515_00019400, partial [Chloebia gouldiae]
THGSQWVFHTIPGGDGETEAGVGAQEADAQRTVEESSRIQRGYGHYFDLSLTNDDLERTFGRLREAMEHLRVQPQWGPPKSPLSPPSPPRGLGRGRGGLSLLSPARTPQAKPDPSVPPPLPQIWGGAGGGSRGGHSPHRAESLPEPGEAPPDWGWGVRALGGATTPPRGPPSPLSRVGVPHRPLCHLSPLPSAWGLPGGGSGVVTRRVPKGRGHGGCRVRPRVPPAPSPRRPLPLFGGGRCDLCHPCPLCHTCAPRATAAPSPSPVPPAARVFFFLSNRQFLPVWGWAGGVAGGCVTRVSPCTRTGPFLAEPQAPGGGLGACKGVCKGVWVCKGVLAPLHKRGSPWGDTHVPTWCTRVGTSHGLPWPWGVTGCHRAPRGTVGCPVRGAVSVGACPWARVRRSVSLSGAGSKAALLAPIRAGATHAACAVPWVSVGVRGCPRSVRVCLCVSVCIPALSPPRPRRVRTEPPHAVTAMWPTLLLLLLLPVALAALALAQMAHRLLGRSGNPFTKPLEPPRPLVTDQRARDKVLKKGECSARPCVPGTRACRARCAPAVTVAPACAGFSARRVPDRLDAVVIGSGVGGLTVAATLAKAGRRVLVLEQHDQAGGCCHTFQQHGFEFDVGEDPRPPGSPCLSPPVTSCSTVNLLPAPVCALSLPCPCPVPAVSLLYPCHVPALSLPCPCHVPA